MNKLAKKITFSLLFCWPFLLASYSQEIVRGQVLDKVGAPLPGANVMVVGTNNSVTTDTDGTFQLANVMRNSIMEISYLGFMTHTVTFTGQSQFRIVLVEDAHLLEEEVVVIGYGTMRKDDLTGSMTAIGEKDFFRGASTSPAELTKGKIAGVQITSNGGRAGSGSRIRIRGGASLSATNDPLIVLDGVPLDMGGISGSSDVLSTINPNDIETMNILKDASATAIYGSRASNGVIIITTKKGQKGGDLKVNFSTLNAISTIARKVDVMDAATFREIITNNPFTSDKYIGYQGEATTNWQNEIYRNAFITDNNMRVSGSIAEEIPFCVSVGFISNDGTLKTDNMKRGSVAFNLSPTFFDDHLSVQLNLKGTNSESRFGNGDAIGAALRMDPTQPVKAEGFETFNGYYTWLTGNSQQLNTLATYNPVALLYSREDNGTALRSIGNLQLDYKFHFFPKLRVNLNIGYDISKGKGDVVTQKWAPNKFIQGGERSKYEQDKTNKLMEFYLNYAQKIANSRLEAMGGLAFQDWKRTDRSFNITNYDGDFIVSEPTYPKYVNQNTLISFYGRLNYCLMEKYQLTATVRQDKSSQFSKKNRWGSFPSVALAWKANEESFLRDVEPLSNLKLRIGYGLTGQQMLDNYEYMTRYALNDRTTQYQIGDMFFHGWQPSEYDSNLKREETAMSNIGLDFGFFRNRLTGSVDLYHKKTKNLLNRIDLPIGSNLTNSIVKNIGNMTSNGYEVSLNVVAISKYDLQWEMGINISHNYSKITTLTLNNSSDSDFAGLATGSISGGTNNLVQMHAVGHAPRTFYLYKQLYFPDGKPIDGAFADLNSDGVINDMDKYFVHKPDPDILLGFNTTLTWQRWTASTLLRVSIGNYMYNNLYSDLDNYSQVFNPNNFLMNTVNDIRNSQFFNRNPMSDYYLSNASFLKMDYFQLGYNIGHVGDRMDLTCRLSIQNVFTITKYKGIEPEINNGIDSNFYPYPRIISVGLNINY